MSRRKTETRQKQAGGDSHCSSRRRYQSQSWRANAIDPDTLPVACEPCRCHKRQRNWGSGKTSPYSLRQRRGNQRKLEDITEEEIAADLRKRIAEIPVPGRSLPRHENIPHLSHELKLRLAMTSVEVEECQPKEGAGYSYHTVRPDSRVVHIQDWIDEEGESEVTLKIRIENIKKAELWKLPGCQSN